MGGHLKHNLKGAYTIWYRDVLRFLRDRSRIFGSLAQPLLFLFALGFGLGGALGKIGGGAGLAGIPYIQFLYPGILCMTVLFTALFSAISIVWDREFGFLREVLVAPVSRTAVALGKVAGGSTVAMFQAAIIMLLGPLLGVHYDVSKVILMLLTLLLLAAVITSLGILIAARQKTMEGFQVIMQFILMPMLFLSGAFFPFTSDNAAGTALKVIGQLNPMSYGVDALRQIALSPKLSPALTLHPAGIDVLILTGFFVVFLVPGVMLFSKQD
ncbi:MAG: ABC transporter permease [Coriobacteriia bacterium]|nr:ABC transporter permease [Coriobacteriia bacterium]